MSTIEEKNKTVVRGALEDWKDIYGDYRRAGKDESICTYVRKALESKGYGAHWSVVCYDNYEEESGYPTQYISLGGNAYLYYCQNAHYGDHKKDIGSDMYNVIKKYLSSEFYYAAPSNCSGFEKDINSKIYEK